MDYRNIVAVLVITFYSPALLLSAILTWRHGWRQSYETWMVLVMFSTWRLAYGAVQLSTINKPDNVGLHIAVVTLAVGGLSPLLWTSIGMLRRLLNVNERHHPGMRLQMWHIWILQSLLTAAVVCAAYTIAAQIVQGIPQQPLAARAAAILNITAFAGIMAAAAFMSKYYISIQRGERRILVVLLLSLPLVLTRTLYLALDVLTDDPRFGAIGGNFTIFLCMALLEEALAVTGYLAVGLTLRVIPSEELEIAAHFRKKHTIWDMSPMDSTREICGKP